MSFPLPDLPYAYDALEPHIDEATMRVHHDKHHAGYASKLAAAVEGTEWANKAIEEILGSLDSLPADLRTAVRNNGGGYLNHSIFWATMSPNGGGVPSGALGDAITRDFGSFDAFREKFAAAATGQFGSGWAWLSSDDSGKLSVDGFPNQDSPVMSGRHAILGVDVWEHAYYLHYQNRRPDYVSAWWNVVNWDEANKRFEAATS